MCAFASIVFHSIHSCIHLKATSSTTNRVRNRLKCSFYIYSMLCRSASVPLAVTLSASNNDENEMFVKINIVFSSYELSSKTKRFSVFDCELCVFAAKWKCQTIFLYCFVNVIMHLSPACSVISFGLEYWAWQRKRIDNVRLFNGMEIDHNVAHKRMI